jgi:hypothetical protein
MSSRDEGSQNDWIAVQSVHQLYQAEILKGRLEDEGIQAVIVNKQDSSYIAFGEIEVFVLQSDIIKAKLIIENTSDDE